MKNIDNFRKLLTSNLPALPLHGVLPPCSASLVSIASLPCLPALPLWCLAALPCLSGVLPPCPASVPCLSGAWLPALPLCPILWIKILYKSKSMVQWEHFASISPYLYYSDGRRNIWMVLPSHCRNRDHVAEYEEMWKWMVEFLCNLKGRGIKIDWVNSIRAVKPLIFFNILRAVAR